MPQPCLPSPIVAVGESLGKHSHQSSSLSMASNEAISSKNFISMSREFNALVLEGLSINHNNNSPTNGGYDFKRDNNGRNNLERIGKGDLVEETNPLATVPDNNPLGSTQSLRWNGGITSGSSSSMATSGQNKFSVQRVKKKATSGSQDINMAKC